MKEDKKQTKEEIVHTKEELREKIEKAFMKNATTKDGRSRAYAFLMYQESMADNWQDTIKATHVPVAVAYHDKDTNPDGEIKKPHYHVLMKFDTKKSVSQIVDIVTDLVADTGGVPSPESVGSVRGYARYLLHMDNPEKYQYDRDTALYLFNGFDFDATIARDDDDYKTLCAIYDYIDANDVSYYSDLMRMLRKDEFEMFKVASKHTYAVVSYLKAYEKSNWRFEHLDKYKPQREYRKKFDKAMREVLDEKVANGEALPDLDTLQDYFELKKRLKNYTDMRKKAQAKVDKAEKEDDENGN